MPTLFDPLRIGNIELDNRIVMAPMTRSRADDEGVQPEYAATYYAQRASAGLIITEATNVSPMAKGYVRTPGIYTDAQIESWRSVTKSVHARGGRIFMQIFHTGRIALPDFLPGNAQPVAPSAVRANGKNYTDEGMKEFVTPREITREEIAQTVKDFATAAGNAITAGFDGVELHSASGYLVQQFLTTNVNLRTDEYGGSIENRSRLLFEVVEAITKEIGGGRTGIRLSPVTPANDASDPDPQPLFDYVVRKLADYGLAYVHIIEGATGGPRDFQQGGKPFDYDALKSAYREAGGKGAWMGNNGYDKALAEAAVAEGHVDLVAFGKLFLANPDLVRRLKDDIGFNEPDKATFYGGSAKGYTDYPVAA